MDRFLVKKKTFLRGIDTTLPTPKNREKIHNAVSLWKLLA